MRFTCNISKDGDIWFVDIPTINASTQGRTKTEAYKMAVDLVENFINDASFQASVCNITDDAFEISGSNEASMRALVTKRNKDRK